MGSRWAEDGGPSGGHGAEEGAVGLRRGAAAGAVRGERALPSGRRAGGREGGREGRSGRAGRAEQELPQMLEIIPLPFRAGSSLPRHRGLGPGSSIPERRRRLGHHGNLPPEVPFFPQVSHP